MDLNNTTVVLSNGLKLKLDSLTQERLNQIINFMEEPIVTTNEDGDQIIVDMTEVIAVTDTELSPEPYNNGPKTPKDWGTAELILERHR